MRLINDSTLHCAGVHHFRRSATGNHHWRSVLGCSACFHHLGEFPSLSTFCWWRYERIKSTTWDMVALPECIYNESSDNDLPYWLTCILQWNQGLTTTHTAALDALLPKCGMEVKENAGPWSSLQKVINLILACPFAVVTDWLAATLLHTNSWLVVVSNIIKHEMALWSFQMLLWRFTSPFRRQDLLGIYAWQCIQTPRFHPLLSGYLSNNQLHTFRDSSSDDWRMDVLDARR